MMRAASLPSQPLQCLFWNELATCSSLGTVYHVHSVSVLPREWPWHSDLGGMHETTAMKIHVGAAAGASCCCALLYLGHRCYAFCRVQCREFLQPSGAPSDPSLSWFRGLIVTACSVREGIGCSWRRTRASPARLPATSCGMVCISLRAPWFARRTCWDTRTSQTAQSPLTALPVDESAAKLHACHMPKSAVSACQACLASPRWVSRLEGGAPFSGMLVGMLVGSWGPVVGCRRVCCVVLLVLMLVLLSLLAPASCGVVLMCVCVCVVSQSVCRGKVEWGDYPLW
jgi:hypothetical protein